METPEQTSTPAAPLQQHRSSEPNTAAAQAQQQHRNSCRCQQEAAALYPSRGSGSYRERIRTCRNTRAAPRDGKWRLLANMFSKPLEMIFFIDLSNFVRWQVIYQIVGQQFIKIHLANTMIWQLRKIYSK